MTEQMEHPVIYVLINDSLNMSAGKVAAQTAHAMGTLAKFHGIHKFGDATKRTVIVLAAKNQLQMDNLDQYLFELGISTGSYIDEGVNEVDSYTVTAMAVGPFEWDDWEKRKIFKSFELYGKKKTLWQKISKLMNKK